MSTRYKNELKNKHLSVYRWYILLSTVYFLYPTFISAQFQIGEDLIGNDQLSRFGQSIALSASGEFMVVGAPGLYYVLSESYAAVYQLNNGGWIQIGDNLGSQEIGDKVGTSVAISGDGKRVAVGIPGRDIIGYNTGIVQVFEYNGNEWKQIGKDIPGDGPIDMFGSSVALSADGSILAASAPYHDAGGENSGLVRIFKYEDGEWLNWGPDFLGPAPHSIYGRSISLSANGERMAIGAPGYAGKKGLVDVFVYVGGPWRRLGHSIKGKLSGYNCGVSVSLSASGRKLAVGSPWFGDSIQHSEVKVFQYQHPKWESLGNELLGNGGEKDCFGVSVSLSADGSRLAVGDPEIYANHELGRTSIFDFHDGVWERSFSVIPGIEHEEHSGYAVALSAYGNLVAVGSPGYGSGWVQHGCVRTYQLVDAGSTTGQIDIGGKSGLTLFQNFPNPFSKETTIPFSLNRPDHIMVEIISMNGQKTETLYQGYKPEGIHHVTWYPKNFPKGVYLYKLSAEKESDVRKMLLQSGN